VVPKRCSFIAVSKLAPHHEGAPGGVARWRSLCQAEGSASEKTYALRPLRQAVRSTQIVVSSPVSPEVFDTAHHGSFVLRVWVVHGGCPLLCAAPCLRHPTPAAPNPSATATPDGAAPPLNPLATTPV
jgi:hypothetical protein